MSTLVTTNIPPRLKDWYRQRAKEQGISLSQLTKEILQGKRKPISGESFND